MTFGPRFSKFMFTAHITFSVGWLGAVAVFLALALVGFLSLNAPKVQGAYVAMEMSGWYVIMPASLGALLTGVVQALGTRWGLFKHYWVMAKLVLTVGATLLLLVHMQSISYAADVAARMQLSAGDLSGLRMRLIFDAGAALFVLLGATVLSVYKPWGRTRVGLAPQLQVDVEGVSTALATRKFWERYVLWGMAAAAGLFLLLHLLGRGMSH